MTFITPLLLIGLAAAGIPFVLHLLSSIRAQEVYFPTLRFLRMSTQKTARRRRIQHWLLLLLRSAMFALLALAVAEPISRAAGGWLSKSEYAAAVVLDNSFSMAARNAAGTRFARARGEARALLSGDHKPTVATLMTTNGGQAPGEMTAKLETLRDGLDRVEIGFGPSTLTERVRAAARLLRAQSAPQKSIYLFSDLQQESFRKLPTLKELAEDQDIHLLIVDCSDGKVGNVAVTDVELTGRRVLNQLMQVNATLVNASPTRRSVEAVLSIEGQAGDQRMVKTLEPAGHNGSVVGVRFFQRFTRPGIVRGQVRLELRTEESLRVDDVRRFSLTITDRVRALIVAGPTGADDPVGFSPAGMLRVALAPWPDGGPWSITHRITAAERFTETDLKGIDCVFFCNVPSFTAEQAEAVAQFVRKGGTAAVFPGPAANTANYNERLKPGTMLPAKLAAAVGRIGPEAKAIPADWVDVAHPYLDGLHKNLDDYLTILVQRYYRVAAQPRPRRTLIRLDNGHPLLLTRSYGRGRCVLCTTSASPRWSNLPVTSLFLPLVARISLYARSAAGADHTHVAGSQVRIRPDPEDPASSGAAAVLVTPPARSVEDRTPMRVALKQTDDGPLAVFTAASRLGTYRWRLEGQPPEKHGPAGQFVVNPHGQESRLEPMEGTALVRMMAESRIPQVYVAPSLEAVHKAALADTQGRNWWDVLLAGVILLLVVEAVVANRHRPRSEDAFPALLNPKVSH